MSRRILGETFDIHGGGLDLVFPHHENEIAQSECCHGKPQAKYWLHNGLMQAAGEAGKVGGRTTEGAKISKSTGATPFTELLERHAPEAIRFFLLSTHYRSPIQYSEDLLASTARSLERFYQFFKRYERVTGQSFYRIDAPAIRSTGAFDPGENPTLKQLAELRERFQEGMDDDFNTGSAIATLFDLLGLANKFVDSERLEVTAQPTADQLKALVQIASTLRELSGTLGLFRKAVEQKSSGDDALVAKLMELLIDLRAAARKNKDFATADKIRQGLTTLKITLEDRPGGTEWTKA